MAALGGFADSRSKLYVFGVPTLPHWLLRLTSIGGTGPRVLAPLKPLPGIKHCARTANIYVYRISK